MKKLGVEVIGVSGDSVQNQKIFKDLNKLNFTLLADADGAVAKAFGVPVREGERTVKKTIAEKDYALVRYVTARRWTFVIGKDGKLMHIDSAAKARQDSKNTLALFEEMAGEEE